MPCPLPPQPERLEVELMLKRAVDGADLIQAEIDGSVVRLAELRSTILSAAFRGDFVQ
jgi:hypothetical protein